MSTQNIALDQDNGSKQLLGGVGSAAKVHVENAVEVSNVPTDYAKEEKQLPDGHKVKDYFTSGQVLLRQVAPADGVLIFSFPTPVSIVVVFSADHVNHISNVDPFGGTPSETEGIPVLPGVPMTFPVETSIVKIWEQSGGEVTVWGYRY